MRPLFIFLSIMGAATVLGQTRDTAAIFGGISDTQGAAIPGASVALTSIATGQVRKVVANESGQYLFSSLPIGGYTLAVEQPAFRSEEHTSELQSLRHLV